MDNIFNNIRNIPGLAEYIEKKMKKQEGISYQLANAQLFKYIEYKSLCI